MSVLQSGTERKERRKAVGNVYLASNEARYRGIELICIKEGLAAGTFGQLIQSKGDGDYYYALSSQ